LASKSLGQIAELSKASGWVAGRDTAGGEILALSRDTAGGEILALSVRPVTKVWASLSLERYLASEALCDTVALQVSG
jgi:hypothetical protein